jgi:hypothetical protein
MRIAFPHILVRHAYIYDRRRILPQRRFDEKGQRISGRGSHCEAGRSVEVSLPTAFLEK